MAGPILGESDKVLVSQIATVFSYITRLQDRVRNELSAEGKNGGRAWVRPGGRGRELDALLERRMQAPTSHLGFVSDDSHQAREALVQLVDAGIREGFLVAVVHPYAHDANAIRYLHGRRLDVKQLRERAFLLLTGCEDGLQSGGKRIDPAHFDWLVSRLNDYAPSVGRHGVQVVCDASHAYLAQGRDEEWFAFEEWLRRGFRHAIGITCLYRRHDLTPDRMDALRAYHGAVGPDVALTDPEPRPT